MYAFECTAHFGCIYTKEVSLHRNATLCTAESCPLYIAL